MNATISAHGLIGDRGTVALIDGNGRLDWLCWPDFDSQACFAGLLGTDENGAWLLAPKKKARSTRQYIDGTLALLTTYEGSSGSRCTVTDFMPERGKYSTVVRIVRGIAGQMRFVMKMAPRFDYGNVKPRIAGRRPSGAWEAVTGPHRLVLRSSAPLREAEGDVVSDFQVSAGETYSFELCHSNSYFHEFPDAIDAEAIEKETIRCSREWLKKSTYQGPYRKAVERSLLTFRALISSSSGGFVAAPTSSLPEKPGGVRNWDFRFCWLRDSTFGVLALLHCGYDREAKGWLDWLSRAVQGDPKKLRTLYGVTGKREHSEWIADWLCGYQDSTPVRIGNLASGQLQLDTFGEVIDALYRSRCHGLYPAEDKSGDVLELPILEHLEEVWRRPDKGLWEFRSADRQLTESKVMAWAAFDRGIRMTERFGMKGPVNRWRKIRDEIHSEVCRKGFNKRLNSFTQEFGASHVDADLLLLPLLGFLPPADPRIVGTVQAIEKNLMRDGLIYRYDTKKVKDGLPAGEGAFLACNFWLVDVYVAQGRMHEARLHFEKVLTLANNLGLLAEEFDPKHGLVGNFPQAISHIALINSALTLETGRPSRLWDLQ